MQDVTELREVTLDITTLTLGEAIAAEQAAGMSVHAMSRSSAAVKVLAMFVHVLRTSGEPPSWSELSSLRLVDVQPSTSRSRPAGASQK